MLISEAEAKRESLQISEANAKQNCWCCTPKMLLKKEKEKKEDTTKFGDRAEQMLLWLLISEAEAEQIIAGY